MAIGSGDDICLSNFSKGKFVQISVWYKHTVYIVSFWNDIRLPEWYCADISWWVSVGHQRFHYQLVCWLLAVSGDIQASQIFPKENLCRHQFDIFLEWCQTPRVTLCRYQIMQFSGSKGDRTKNINFSCLILDTVMNWKSCPAMTTMRQEPWLTNSISSNHHFFSGNDLVQSFSVSVRPRVCIHSTPVKARGHLLRHFELSI
jgi:hypothetical protein